MTKFGLFLVIFVGLSFQFEFIFYEGFVVKTYGVSLNNRLLGRLQREAIMASVENPL